MLYFRVDHQSQAVPVTNMSNRLRTVSSVIFIPIFIDRNLPKNSFVPSVLFPSEVIPSYLRFRKYFAICCCICHGCIVEVAVVPVLPVCDIENLGGSFRSSVDRFAIDGWYDCRSACCVEFGSIGGHNCVRSRVVDAYPVDVAVASVDADGTESFVVPVGLECLGTSFVG